jgi:hypothetical protein
VQYFSSFIRSISPLGFCRFLVTDEVMSIPCRNATFHIMCSLWHLYKYWVGAYVCAVFLTLPNNLFFIQIIK